MAWSESMQPVIERIQDQLASMSERDRRLLLGLVVFALVAIVGGGIWLMGSKLDELESKVADRHETLRRLETYAAEYAESKAQAEAIARRIAEHEGTDLSAFLEQVGARTQVGDRLDSVRQKSTNDDGDLVESVYAVKLSKLTQAELAEFLYEVESAGYPLRIRSLTVKSRKRGGEVTLNVDMDISAFRLSAPPEEP